MKLITKDIEEELLRNPLYSNESKPADQVKIIVKFFTPWTNWTWYATEGSKTEDGDWRFFGLVRGHETELGYFLLSELESVRGPFGLKIERDMHFHDKTLAQAQAKQI